MISGVVTYFGLPDRLASFVLVQPRFPYNIFLYIPYNIDQVTVSSARCFFPLGNSVV